MKKTIVALSIGALIGSLLTGLVAMTSAVASDQGSQSTITVAQNPVVQPVVVVQAEAVVESDDDEPRRTPSADPVLGGGSWGTRSDKVEGALGDAVTSDSHDYYVETYESRLLAKQQAEEFLELFENSRGVRRLITEYGGDPDGIRTRYYVKAIDANEDRAGNSTPWVTATLRADFASPEGKRGIEMRVYRKKLSHSRLDNTPYISSTQISYLNPDGSLSRDGGYHPPGETGVSSDGLATIRFKN